ncbi:MAG TPA: lytic transglycosylase domain-containing protein [Quisquiliibacterium sp.]|nr:lytic transglycosylase domain-containing protein [Quisquiliibacterium sp.]
MHYAPEYDGAEEGIEIVADDTVGGTHPASAATPFASSTPARHGVRLSAEQQNVARFIASRYRLASDQTQELVEQAYRTAKEAKLDPWLVLAVISVESSFNPRAQSNKGAQGLMQVLTRVHAEKFAPFGGVAAAFDPLANMRVGTQILKEYLVRAEGSVEHALKSYVGAALLPHDGGYGAKVLFERERIAAAASGRAQPTRAPATLARIEQPRAQARGETEQARIVEVSAARTADAAGQGGAELRTADVAFRPWVEVNPGQARDELLPLTSPDPVSAIDKDRSRDI